MPWDTCLEIACPACSTATLVVLNLEPLHSFCSSNSRYSCTLTICVLFELRLKLGFCCSWVFSMPLYWPSEEEGFRCTVFSYCLSVYLSGYYIDQVLKFGFVSKSSFDSSLLVPPWIFAFASQDNIPSLKLKTWLDLRWRSCCHFYIGSFAWVASRKSNCCPSSPTLQMTSDFDTLVPKCLQLWCFLRFYQRFCLLCWYCFCYLFYLCLEMLFLFFTISYSRFWWFASQHLNQCFVFGILAVSPKGHFANGSCQG